MKYFCLILSFNIVFYCGFAQGKHQSESDKENFFSKQNMQYSVAYFGNFIWNPGLKIGVGVPFMVKQKIKNKIKKKQAFTKTIIKERLFDGDIGFYCDPQSHVGVFTTYGIVFRRTNHKNRQLIFKINPLGYYRSFLPETYEVKEGEVSKVLLPGRSYYSPSISFGVGKKRDGKRLNAAFFNLNIMVLAKYNTNILPIISIEYGYRFGVGLKNKIK